MSKLYRHGLHYRSFGDDVKDLQKALGLSSDISNGVWGDETEKAVRDFQEKHNIKEIGLGPKTLLALLEESVQQAAVCAEVTVPALESDATLPGLEGTVYVGGKTEKIQEGDNGAGG